MVNRFIGTAVSFGLVAIAVAGPARSLQIEDGDVVGVFVKNGAELVVNLGPFEAGVIDLGGKFGGPQFGGNPKGAKFVALAVEEPDRTIVCCGVGAPLPQENIIYTTLAPEPMPTDLQIEKAMNSVDTGNPGATVWFNLMRNLPGSDSEQIDSTANFSYETVLGLGTDAIGNNFTFSTGGVVDEDAGTLTIPIYSDVRGYAEFGGPDTQYLTLGEIRIDGDEVEFVVPEAAQALQSAFVLAMLVFGAARRLRIRSA